MMESRFLRWVENDLPGVRLSRNVPRHACVRVGMESAKEHDQSAGMIGQPGKYPSGHGLIPRPLSFVVLSEQTDVAMAGHGSPELFEASGRASVARQELHFFGGERFTASEFPCHRLRRIQADDGNFVPSAPGKNAPVSGRCFAPAAIETRALREFGPGDSFLEIVV